MDAYLRDATEADMDLLFKWVNDPAVRKSAFLTDTIPYENHVQWYQNLLKRQDCKQYIYVYEDEPIGQARVTLRGDVAEIDYSICSQKRGMGHGSKLLQLLSKQIRHEHPEIHTLEGYVKPENIASQKAFSNSGFNEKCIVFELNVKTIDS